jgi:hypothetical protein
LTAGKNGVFYCVTAQRRWEMNTVAGREDVLATIEDLEPTLKNTKEKE